MHSVAPKGSRSRRRATGSVVAVARVAGAAGAVAAVMAVVLLGAGGTARGAPISPVAPALGFTVFVEGDGELNRNETEGSIAIGGNLLMRDGYQIATSGAGVAIGGMSDIALLVGGQVDLAGSTGRVDVQGGANAVVGDTSNGTFLLNGGTNHFVRPGGDTGSLPQVRFNGAGALETGTLIDFPAQFAQLRATSTAMAALTPATCASVADVVLRDQNGNGTWPGSGNGTIDLTDGRTNVLSMTSSQISALTAANNEVPSATRPLVINVVDAGAITFTPPNWAATQNAASFVLWNFPNATSISITSGNALWGTLFAPFADVVDNGSGNIEGNVVAKSVVFGVQPGGDAGEVHRRNALAFTVDCIDTTTTTSTTTTSTTTTLAPTTSTTTTTTSTTLAPTTTTTTSTTLAPTTTSTTTTTTSTTLAPTTTSTTTTTTSTTLAPTTTSTTTTTTSTTLAPTTTSTTTTTLAPTTTSTTTSTTTTTTIAGSGGGSATTTTTTTIAGSGGGSATTTTEATTTTIAGSGGGIPTTTRPSSGSALPQTGDDPAGLVRWACWLIGVGAALVIVQRARRPDQSSI